MKRVPNYRDEFHTIQLKTNNFNSMKTNNIKSIIYVLGIMFAFAACQYEDYDIAYEKTSTYFVHQEYNRNIVVGEGLRLKAGIMFGGLIGNPEERKVQFEIDPALVPDGKTIMPANYYTLEDVNTITIPAGETQGYLPVTMDSALFLADSLSMTGDYVIPVRLTGSQDVDSIVEGKDYQVMSVSYWAKQHGYYYYNGTSVKKENGSIVSSDHYESLRSENDGIRELSTVGPTKLKMVAATKGPDPSKGVYSVLIDVPTHGGGNVVISSAIDSGAGVTPEGASTYDEENKTFILNYAYSADGFDYSVSDTLVFRNRIRDVQSDGQGVNEWR